MVKKLLLIFLLFTTYVYADNEPVTHVEMLPIQNEVSISTVILDTQNWETCPTIELRGRKALLIQNMSTSENAYLGTFETPNVVKTLYPKQDIYFEITSDIHIYASCNTAETTIEIIEMR